MSAYLSQHLPHLQSLHTQLALDSTALQADQDRIETAIKAAVEALLREREQQVDEYKDVISGQKRRLGCLARAVGDKGRNVVQGSRRESMENETLPKQLEKLVKQSEELEKVYDERLKHIEKQQSYLNQLAILLGSPFEPAKPLESIASSSALTAAPGLARIVSGTAAGARLSSGRGGDTSGGNPGVEDKEALYDVSEAVTEQLDKSVSAALEERASRLVELESSMHDLRTLHTELALPPIPIAHPHHFPLHMLPNRSSEETPGAHQGYEKLLSKVITEKVATTTSIGEDGEEVEVESDLESMQGVEPESGLIRWVEAVRELWEQEQSNRAARIQELYDQLEPLWQRLQLDQAQTDLFIQMNIGCSEAAIKAYEAELERCYELRRSSLSSFIVAVRDEIDTLWTELMLSDEEKSDFGAYINDDYSEEMLAEHETYIERLRAEIESKSNLLPKVREWHALVIEEDELERAQTDPDRYKRRGGAMLREEKLRKRVTMLKPKVEQDLLSLLPVWEEANGRPFMVQGERVVDKIHDALEAKELAKEAKKRIRMGLAPTAPPAPKPLGPAKTVRPTPNTGRTASSAPMSTISRKREAPTPTPLAFGMNKRTRIAPPSSTISNRTATSTSSRITSGSRIPSSSIAKQAYSANARIGTTTKIRDQSSSPTLVPPCGLPRFISCNKSQSRIPLPSFSAAAPTPTPASMTTNTIKLPPLHQLAKANGRRPRRESFRPRQSIMIMSGLGMTGGGMELRDGLEEMMEEEGDVFE